MVAYNLLIQYCYELIPLLARDVLSSAFEIYFYILVLHFPKNIQLSFVNPMEVLKMLTTIT